MDRNKLNYLLAGIILAFIVWTFIIDHKPKPEIRTEIKTDTLYVDRVNTITKWKAKLDTVLIPYVVNNYDTLWIPQPIASADTILTRDSSWIKVKYFFPPANYFNADFGIKEKIVKQTITNYIPIEETFWDRFNWSIQGGFGYGLINEKFDVYIGIGASIKIK